MNRREHWEHVYRTKAPDQVSWFQAEAQLSQALIADVAPDRATPILDVGAGASTLIDGLLSAGYHNCTVLDLSGRALELSQQRLGSLASSVTWMCGDVLTTPLPTSTFAVWHDRAVFHFLTDAEERAAYVAQVRRALRPGGHLIIATFAEDGPMRCSGLDVARYSPAALHGVFGSEFRHLESRREMHTTPSGGQQAFTYCVCTYERQEQ